jgi:3',5'-cyclic AMP phosphodiesterase CpdA
MVTFTICLVCFSGCLLVPDDQQVQVVMNPDKFKPFESPPRPIVYGPYTLKVTSESAIIAWEEKWHNPTTPRHVEVLFEDLLPSTEYFYRVNGAGKEGRFVTAPGATEPFSFFVWGDSRTGISISNKIAAQMITVDPDASFALHTGDMVYDGDRQEYWEEDWFTPMSDLLLHLPVYPTMGNHEVNSEFYYRYFSSLGGWGTNYSFDWGEVHFLVLDSNKINFGSDEQIEWIMNDLETHRDARFTVVSHHHPVYDASPSGSTGITYLQDTLQPLYEEYGVDLVFNGHVHNYQRHFRNNITYVVSACGGERPYDYGVPLPGMTLQLHSTYHFCHGYVKDNTMHITTYNNAGIIIDSTTIDADSPTEIYSQVVVEATVSEVARGKQCSVEFILQDVSNLDVCSFTMPYHKTEPPVMLKVLDADSAREGVQIRGGEMGGEVALNHADDGSGEIIYQEANLGGLFYDRATVASATFEVPDDASITALYLVPHFTLIDTSGKEIPHFMGGANILIKKE